LDIEALSELMPKGSGVPAHEHDRKARILTCYASSNPRKPGFATWREAKSDMPGDSVEAFALQKWSLVEEVLLGLPVGGTRALGSILVT
jgi:hypothetical protein